MKISIITVTFNSEKTIRETLNSIKNQTYPDIEHIIIDGKSTDNTLKIVEDFPHVSKVISEKDNGIYDAMNKGIKIAKGDVIGILNSDDIYASKNTLSNVMSIFDGESNIDSVYGNIIYFKNNSPSKITRTWVTKSYYGSFFEDGEILPHPGLFVRKKIYKEIGAYKTDFEIGADYEFIFRMLKMNNCSSFFIDETIVKMREGGISTKNVKSYFTSLKEVKRAWEINNMPIPKNFYLKRYLRKIKQLIA